LNFIKGLLFGILIGTINFSVLYFFIKKFSVLKNKAFFVFLYIIKLLFIALLLFLFIKFKFGNIIGVLSGFTLTLIVFNIGIMLYVRTTRSN